MEVPYTQFLFSEKLKKEVLKCDPQDFINKVREISYDLNIVPDWLMLVMDLETGGTFDPSITNSLGYTGLIQFGSARASDVGTTRGRLRKMNALEQLDYVHAALLPFIGRMNHLHDVYLAVFWPAAVGRPLGYVLQTKRTSAYKVAINNPLFDTNRDNRIQVYEIKKKLLDRLPLAYKWIV